MPQFGQRLGFLIRNIHLWLQCGHFFVDGSFICFPHHDDAKVFILLTSCYLLQKVRADGFRQEG